MTDIIDIFSRSPTEGDISGECKWKIANGFWESGCGESHLFLNGGPLDNEYKYCPYCGFDIEEAENE